MADSSDSFPAWLVRSKVTPIVQKVDILSRPSLTARLNGGLDASLTLLHAPAGYGKSTALADWCDTLAHRGTEDVAWLSLDRDDNDPFQLVLYFAFSLSCAGVRIAAGEIEGTSGFSNLSVRHLLNVVHTAIERHQRKVLLVLDDFEHLAAEVVAAVIEPFLRYAPANLHVAIAGRRDGTLKTADMEIRGLAHRLSAKELRFSLDELLEFLAPGIDANSIRKVYAVTEGWPVAVQLLRTAIKAERDVHRILAHLSVDNERITAWLSEQVFDELDDASRSFLMDVSIVERIDPNFCDFIRERDDSSEVLSGLKELDALVTPLDRRGFTYRLHPMFREYLHHQLIGAGTERAAALNVLAGRWFAKRGDLIKAVRHSVEGGDPDGAAQYMLAAGGLMLWLTEGLSRLPRALAMLDERTVRNNPRLALIQCLLLMKTGQPFQARRLYESTVESLPPGYEDDRQLAYEVTIIQDLIPAYTGQAPSEKLFASLEQSLAGIPASEHAMLGHHFTVLCGLNSFRGRTCEAKRYAMQGIDCFRRVDSAYGETYLHLHLGDIGCCEGMTAEAEEHYKTALGYARTNFNDDKAIKLVIDVLRAEVRYAANRLDLIPRSADRFPKRLKRLEAWFNIHAAALVVSSNVAFSRTGLSAALSILDLQEDLDGVGRLTGLRNLIACQRAALLQRGNQDDAAAATLAEIGLSIDRYHDEQGMNVGWREREVATQTLLRMYIRQNAASRAMPHLDRLLRSSGERNHIRSCTALLILRALANRQLEEWARAFEDLGRALELAAGSRNVRVFLDESRPARDLLDAFIDGGAPGREAAARIELARQVRSHYGQGEREEVRMTDRELQVLHELERGYPNKVIARNIGISHNTVRYHLKNIFSKLNVDNRLQAVGAARKANVL